jgi:hypothetical protein
MADKPFQPLMEYRRFPEAKIKTGIRLFFPDEATPYGAGIFRSAD